MGRMLLMYTKKLCRSLCLSVVDTKCSCAKSLYSKKKIIGNMQKCMARVGKIRNICKYSVKFEVNIMIKKTGGCMFILTYHDLNDSL